MAWVVVGRRPCCRIQYASAAEGGRRQQRSRGGGAGHHCPAAAAASRCLHTCLRSHRRGPLDFWSGWTANGKPQSRFSAAPRGLLPTDEEGHASRPCETSNKEPHRPASPALAMLRCAKAQHGLQLLFCLSDGIPVLNSGSTMIDDTLVQRPLYGGAAQLSFPQRFTDISDFRPVPDHQEVLHAPGTIRSLNAPQQHTNGGSGHWRRRRASPSTGECLYSGRPLLVMCRYLLTPTWISH
jgi:hypothetical protein